MSLKMVLNIWHLIYITTFFGNGLPSDFQGTRQYRQSGNSAIFYDAMNYHKSVVTYRLVH